MLFQQRALEERSLSAHGAHLLYRWERGSLEKLLKSRRGTEFALTGHLPLGEVCTRCSTSVLRGAAEEWGQNS